MRVCSGHRGRVRLYQARVCERSVNAGTLVSPRGGDRSSVWETQAESACTRQPQAAEESRRSGELARRAPARAPAPRPLPPAALRRVIPLPAGRAAGALGGAGSLLPGRGGARGAGAPCLPAGGRDSAAPGWAAPGWSGLRWAARPASARLSSARSLGSARLGSARRCPGRSLAAHAARGGRGAGWRAGAGGGRGSGPPRGRLEAPYLGSDVRGSRRGRTTHFFPFTPQSFLSPRPGDPGARAGRLSGRLGPGVPGFAARRLGSPGGQVPAGGRPPGRVCVWGIPGSWRPQGGSARRPPR